MLSVLRPIFHTCHAFSVIDFWPTLASSTRLIFATQNPPSISLKLVKFLPLILDLTHVYLITDPKTVRCFFLNFLNSFNSFIEIKFTYVTVNSFKMFDCF